MRPTALCALALTSLTSLVSLASGCNWVFGLDPVTLTDAAAGDVPIDARLPTVKLSAITPMLTGDGGTTMQATYVPITPAPRVQYGRVGQPLVDTSYTGVDVQVGYEFAEATETWRLVYTLAGGVPHEVHWRPSAISRPGHATVLQLTPNDREAVPTPGTFVLDATGAPSTWEAPRVYTTNTWTVDPGAAPDTGVPTRVTSDFASMFTTAMAGPKRKPDPTKDLEVLLDYDTTAAASRCMVAKGSAAFHIDLATGTSPDASPPIYSSTLLVDNYTITGNAFGLLTNLTGASGVSLSAVSKIQTVTYGPGGSIPLHFQRETAAPLPISLPIPVGILLAKCIDAPTDQLPRFTRPIRASLATVGSLGFVTTPITLANGQVTIQNGLVTSSMGTGTSFTMSFDHAAFAAAPTVDGTSVNVKTETSEVALSGGGSTALLDFEIAGGATPLADFYEATLYRVDGADLVPVREFTFTERPLRFDRDQGQPSGSKYVFGIHVIHGASANVANGDFSVWGNTQTLGVTYTQIFTLAP